MEVNAVSLFKDEWLDFNKLDLNEDDSIKKIKNHLEEGGEIDARIEWANNLKLGTILHHSIASGSRKIVQYVLDNGANLTLEAQESVKCDSFSVLSEKRWNALELAILRPSMQTCSDEISEMIKKKSFELYSQFGLHPLHIDCVRGKISSEYYLTPSNINKIISIDSPMWPGLSPLYLAAKNYHEKLAQRLLDLGASPKVRDLARNTPLHFLSEQNKLVDDRLFIHDEEDTFGDWTGESHFHIACKSVQLEVRFKAQFDLNLVKKFLKLGVSPNLQTRKGKQYFYDEGNTPLHFARNYELAELLLECGADVHRKNSLGETALQTCLTEKFSYVGVLEMVERTLYICLLMESGSKCDHKPIIHYIDKFIEKLRDSYFTSCKSIFLRYLTRTYILNKKLLCERLQYHYQRLLAETTQLQFNHTIYAKDCSEELNKIDEIGLRPILSENIVKPNFKSKFGHIKDVNYDSWPTQYPIYGRKMKIKFKRALLEFKRKKEYLPKALPCLLNLVKQFCQLPSICADMILSHFNADEIDQFIQAFSDKNMSK